MRTQILKISGMHCAACVAGLERSLRKVAGVTQVVVNLVANTAQVRYDEQITSYAMLKEAVEKMSFHVVEGVKEEDFAKIEECELNRMRLNMAVAFVFWLMLMYVSMSPMVSWLPKLFTPTREPVKFALSQFCLLLPILWAGRGFFIRGFKSIKNLLPTMDTLVALGSGSAVVYSLFSIVFLLGGVNGAARQLYFESAGTIITFVLIGKLLEQRGKKETGSAIRSIMALVPPKATVVLNGLEETVPVTEIMPGDQVVVRTGFSIPVDGVITSGCVSINEAMLTGESRPRTKEVGDEVYGGTMVVDGHLHMRVTQVGADTVLAKIKHFVEDAQCTKPPIARLADRAAGIFVPCVLAIAVLAATIWFVITGEMSTAMWSFISVLVVACPCSLGLATPLAIMVAIGKAAEMGILFREAAGLEAAGKVKIAVFDKTGTITEGRMSVTDVYALGVSEQELWQYLGAAEATSSHPLGSAIREKAQGVGAEAVAVDSSRSYVGSGMEIVCSGTKVRVGSKAFALTQELPVELANLVRQWKEEGKSVVYAAQEGKLLGAVALRDTVRKDAAKAISQLKALGVFTCMLTGDDATTAEAIGREVGVDRIEAGLLPQDKVSAIAQMQQRHEGNVIMVGDGINDAPALAKAHVGIALGTGTDVAVESADVVLRSAKLTQIPTLIRLSRATISNIKQNLVWAFIYNIISIPIAAGAFYYVGRIYLRPELCAIAMSLSSLSVVTNALRLRNFK